MTDKLHTDTSVVQIITDLYFDLSSLQSCLISICWSASNWGNKKPLRGFAYLRASWRSISPKNSQFQLVCCMLPILASPPCAVHMLAAEEGSGDGRPSVKHPSFADLTQQIRNRWFSFFFPVYHSRSFVSCAGRRSAEWECVIQYSVVSPQWKHPLRDGKSLAGHFSCRGQRLPWQVSLCGSFIFTPLLHISVFMILFFSIVGSAWSPTTRSSLKTNTKPCESKLHFGFTTCSGSAKVKC